MKVAVLLHGQPRCALETGDYIKNNIIIPNQADVFIHMWYDKENNYMEKGELDRGECYLEPNLDKKIIEFYSPKQYLIEKQKFTNFNNFNCNYFELPNRYIENYQKCGKNQNLSKDQVKLRVLRYTHLSQLYSIFKCNLLKEEFSYDTNTLYDFVIKIRFDAIPKRPFICNHLNNNYLYYQDLDQPDNIISDWFNASSNEIMNIYCSMFLLFKYLNNPKRAQNSNQLNSLNWNSSEGIISLEYLTRNLMDNHHISCSKVNLGLTLHRNS